MIPTLVQRPPWASNANFSTGPIAGHPTKVQPLNAYLAEGIEPNAQGVAEYENWWRNQIDIQLLIVRLFAWNTIRATVNDASLITDIARSYDGQVISVQGDNNWFRANDGDFPPIGTTYSAEGTGLTFKRCLAPDIAPTGGGPFLLAGHKGSTSNANNFGVWQLNNITGSIVPVVDSGGLIFGGVVQIDRLVRCVGGYAYAFLGGSDVFYRISPDVMPAGAGGTHIPQFHDTIFLPSSLTAAHLAAVTISGVDTICQADYVSGNAVITIAANPFSAAIAVTTRGTAHPRSVAWNATFGAFLVLYNDGSIDAVDAVSGVVSAFAPAPGLLDTVSAARLCDQGWLGLGVSGALTYYSSDFFTAKALGLVPRYSALGLALFDGECYWIPNTTSSGQGSMQRTLHTT